MDEPCPLRDGVLDCEGHALVIGGPGSGKTTIALRKAVKRIKEGLLPGQSALFLSFSRAAVARIADAAKLEASGAERDLLSIQTFHSLFWEVLKAHGYLLGAPRKLSILLPHDERALSDGIGPDEDGWDEWIAERDRLFREEGRVAFDLFAPYAMRLLATSGHLLRTIARTHPIIIVDEAQDTADHPWACIELLAQHSQILCLADLDQQIFDYLPGVGPERVEAIRRALRPLEVDLGTQNHRSPDSEILAFGNDVLAGAIRGAPYRGVSCIHYQPERPPPVWNHLLRRALGQALRAIRAQSGRRPETLAILVSNNRTALRVSNALNAVNGIGKAVPHKLMFDEAEALLSARVAAFLLEPKDPEGADQDLATVMELIVSAKRSTGKGREAVKTLAKQAAALRAGKPGNIKIIRSIRQLLADLRDAPHSGDPAKDWLAIKLALRSTGQAELVDVASQLDFLVAFRRGHRISANLAALWLASGRYANARIALDLALAQEQMLDGIEPPSGLQVMNVHKAKGKQFDGVIVLREARRTGEGVFSSFVWRGDDPPHVKSRRLLRVAVTRAREHVVLLDPLWPPCPLLRGHRF